MPKADLTLPTGAKVSISGTSEEIKDLFSHLNLSSSKVHKSKSVRKKSTSKSNGKKKITPTTEIRKLCNEKFLDEPKSLVQMQYELKVRGRIFEQKEISSALIQLLNTNNPPIARVKGESEQGKKKSVWLWKSIKSK